MSDEQLEIVEAMRAQLETWDYDPATEDRVRALLQIIEQQAGEYARLKAQQQAVIDAARAVDGRVFRPDGFLEPDYGNAGAQLFELRDALDKLTK